MLTLTLTLARSLTLTRPFYLEHIMLGIASGEGGADLGPFAVLRVIRLTRVVRVLKAFKSMRSPVVLARTLANSAVPVMMLASMVRAPC